MGKNKKNKAVKAVTDPEGDPEGLKAAGNAAYAEGEYLAAIMLYSLAI